MKTRNLCCGLVAFVIVISPFALRAQTIVAQLEVDNKSGGNIYLVVGSQNKDGSNAGFTSFIGPIKKGGHQGLTITSANTVVKIVGDSPDPKTAWPLTIINGYAIIGGNGPTSRTLHYTVNKDGSVD